MAVFISKTILVVEDDATTAQALARRLEASGYRVFSEAWGAKALETAAKQALDLVILDLRLPDMSGYDVCRELKKSYGPWLPVLMLTGMNRDKDQLKGFSHGADAYLTKPFKSQELLKTIAFLLGDKTFKEMPEGPECFTIQEVAKRFGVNASTVYRLALRGLLPGFKVGSQWRFSRPALEAWMADQITIEGFKADEKGEKNDTNIGH